MASSTSNFRQGLDEAGRERESDPDDDLAPGKRTLTRYLSGPQDGGRALPQSITGSLGSRLGGLDDVRVHDDAKAGEMVRSMGAAGFTYGRNIYVADGANDDTLAHEAAHAAQHRGPAPTGPVQIGRDSGHEEFADRAAAARHAPSMELSAPTAAPAVRFRDTQVNEGDVVAILVKEIAKNKSKAGQMLRNADPSSRSRIEAAVRQAFPDKDDAKDLIEKNPSGGKAAPTVKGADEAASQGQGKDGGKKGGPPGGSKITKGGPAGKVAGKGDKPDAHGDDQPHELPPKPDADLAATSTEGLGLIQQELVEHEKWKGGMEHAREELKVGEAGDEDRAAFVADAAGKGVATGAATGVATAVVGKALTKGLEWGAVKLVGKEIPGIGAVLAGGMSAYSLATKNWKESGAKIASFGTGSDDYETLANSLAAIGEVLDIAINIMNVIAGVITILAGLLWLITIITLGVASPFAATMTAFAAGIVAVTTILDMINRACIQPMVMLFRVMHTFTTKADPRDVAEQGDGITESASDAASFFAAKGVEKGMDKIGGGEGEIGDAKKGSGSEGEPETTKTEGTHSEPKSEGESKAGGDEHKAGGDEHKAGGDEHKAGGDEHKAGGDDEKKKAGGDDEKKATGDDEKKKGDEGEGDKEKTKEDKKAEKEKERQAEEEKQKHEQEQAKKKLEDAEAAKKKIEDESKKNADERKDNAETRDEKVKEAREKAAEEAKQKFDAEAEAKHAEIDQKLKERLAEIDEKAKADGEKLDEAHKAREAAAKEAATAEQAASEKAADAKATAEKSAAEARRDAAKQAAADKVAHAQAEEPAKFKADADKLEAKHAAASKEISAIENEQMRADAQASENKSYSEAKAELESQKAAAKAEAVAHAQAEQAAADAKADAKYTKEVTKADLAAENAKAKAKLLADKQIAAAETQSGKEVAAHEAAVTKERAEANEQAGDQAEAADDLAKAKTKAAGDEAATVESDKIQKERDKLRAEARKLANENAEAEKKVMEAKTEAEDKGAYKKTAGDKWADRVEVGSNDVDLSIIKNPLEKSIFTPAGEAAGLTKGEKKEEPPKPGEPTTIAGKTGKVFTDTASVFSPGADKKRYDDFKDGFKEGPKKARVMLPDPPGTTAQLDQIKAKIAADLKARATYEKAEHHNATTEQEEKANAAKLKAAEAKGKEVTDISKQHEGKVDEKDAAIGQQKDKNTEAHRTIVERSQRMAGVTAVTIPLAAFTGFMWLGAKLPGSAGAKMQKMYNDGQNLLKQFASITGKFGDTKAKTEGAGTKLDADKQKNADTKKKAEKTSASLKTTEGKIKEMDGKVSANAATAGGEKQKASSGKAAADASAKKGEGEYAQLMGQLTTWATNHKALRTAGGDKKEGAHE